MKARILNDGNHDAWEISSNHNFVMLETKNGDDTRWQWLTPVAARELAAALVAAADEMEGRG